MTDQPPLKRGIPRWLIIAGIVGMICVCIVFGAVIFTLLSPSIEVGRLPEVCMQKNPGMDRQACDAWAKDVAGTSVFSACFHEEMDGGNPDANNLYFCLDDNGVGPK